MLFFFAVAILAFSNGALAVENQGTVGDCSNATTYNVEQCLMGDTINNDTSNPWWCFWCPNDQPKDQDCNLIKVIDYTTCVAKCTCIYNNAVKKCDGQTCKDAQQVDYKACQTQCQIDWVSTNT
ncbi:MAG TPA: hypothetical protein VF381_03875 [Thermoanaerobaculia bacterium]